VAHAFDVIEELAKQQGEIGVTDLAKRLKLHKNNVFRLLATLELRGYAEQNLETENYRLGVKALELGQSYQSQSKLINRAVPIMKALNEKINETVSLVVMQNGQLQFPISLEAKRTVKVSSRVAVSYPAKQIPSGRLLLAQLSDSVLSEMLASNSPQDAAIKNQLTELRLNGQIVDRAASEADVVAVARIVKGTNNEVIGALEILIPQYRAKLENILPAMEEATTAISNAMGWQKKGLIASVEKATIEKGSLDKSAIPSAERAVEVSSQPVASKRQ